MFIDTATVQVEAGDGGDGVVSFRHEKYVDKGGPDGGDGGRGGNIIMRASLNQNTLAGFRYQKLLKATDGGHGDKRKRHGRNGDDLVVAIPVGTTVVDTEGTVVFDFIEDGQAVIIAKGGDGGYGNAHFISSTRQAPRVAEKGEQGEKKELHLELKMIADIGLVGLPNAGKSTFLATVSNARPEIADYAFTTLTPNLGVVDIDNTKTMLLADIPGLIEGASEGKGLGDAFLRHIERTTVIIHLIDIYQEDIVATYQTIQKELAQYKVDISTKPQLVAITKCEVVDADMVADQLAQLRKVVPKSTQLFAISSVKKTGISELLQAAYVVVQKAKTRQADVVAKQKAALPVITLPEQADSWKIVQKGKVWVVSGRKIERFAARTDFENPHGVRRLRDIMKKMGIMHELTKQGIEAGQTIRIGNDYSLEY